LGEGFTAGASHAGADEPPHHEVTGDVIQFFGHVLTHLSQGAAASIACLTGRQDFIFAIKVVGQRLAAVLTLGACLDRGFFVTGRRLGMLILCRLRDLVVFRQVERQLIHTL